MPIPTPYKGKKPESKNEFISRCMGDKVMNNDYKDNSQRAAICYSQWKEHTKNASAVIAIKDDEIAYFTEET